jgi:hypothetical protein
LNKRVEMSYQHAQKQTANRPNDNAADRARLHIDDTNDANGREGEEVTTSKAKANRDGSGLRQEGENNPARLLAETAGSYEGKNSLKMAQPLMALKNRGSDSLPHRQRSLPQLSVSTALDRP